MSTYLELLAAHGLPVDQKFTDHLWNKYIAGGFDFYDITVKKDEQKKFESLIFGKNPIWLDAIQIESNGKKYKFIKDTQVLEIFSLALMKLQKEWKKKKPSFGARQHEFYIQVKNLNEYLEKCFSKYKIKISPRKIYILIYDLMSLHLADSPECRDIFPAARPNEPKLDTDQIKAARINSILKSPKIVKLKKRNS